MALFGHYEVVVLDAGTYPPDGTSETLAYAIGAWLRGAARSSTGQRRDARPSTPLG